VIPQALLDQLRREGSITLTLKVIPKSSRNQIVGVTSEGALKVKITAAPEKGKANAAICEFLAKEFDVPRTNVQILRGQTSTNKQIHITARPDP
jgi:uncharacterized protein